MGLGDVPERGPVSSRRGVLLGAAGSALAAVAVPGLAPAPASAAAKAPRAVAHAATSGRAVVAVERGANDALTTAVVTDADGAELGRATLTTSGRGLIPVWLSGGRSRSVLVTLTNATAAPVTPWRRRLTVSGSQAALQASPWRVVNKRTPLPASVTPRRLKRVHGVEIDEPAAEPLQALFAAASRARIDLVASNGYRSYAWQSRLYADYVRRDGERAADTYSARPGHSEHQTGLTVDFKAGTGECSLQECFADTAQGRFLARQAAQHGWLVRYTPQNQDVTGYRPEPWHLRWVGRWLTGFLAETHQDSLEEAFALPAAPDYGRDR